MFRQVDIGWILVNECAILWAKLLSLWAAVGLWKCRYRLRTWWCVTVGVVMMVALSSPMLPACWRVATMNTTSWDWTSARASSWPWRTSSIRYSYNATSGWRHILYFGALNKCYVCFSELWKVLFFATSVCVFLFVYEVSRELLNGFAPNSHWRRVWSLI